MLDIYLHAKSDVFIKITSTDNITKITDRHIFEFVEGQWQLSDLWEISNENGCLPRNLVQQTRTVLTGTYILQVDKMYDIASAKYKQLCEIRKINNKNLEVIDEEKPAEWQPKGRRMMQLCLTDGVQDITAIEYTPVNQITGILLPGYKVMIIGPIDCRRGIILLEDGKYKEVGGEVETLLKSNALENVLARALGEPENPDPYNDNESSSITDQNAQSVANPNPNNNDSFFDDNFEEAVDLEAVTAIEQRSQEINAVQERFESTCGRSQMLKKETNEIIEETLEDIDFEPLEDWPSDPPRPSRVSRMETKKIDEKDDVMIIEQASTSTRDFCNKSPHLTNSIQNQNFSEFPDDDFDFDDCDIIIKTKESQSQQNENPLKNKTEMCPSSVMPTKLMKCNASVEVKKCTFIKTAQNEKSMVNTLRAIQVPKTKTIPNFFEPPSASKICDNLSDVLCEPITGKIYKTVRGQVKSHSALTKQGKCWSVTALITDHTSSVEVCFDSEILEDFLGFTVQEFLQKKKLAKMDPQADKELRLSLRKAQHEIQNLDALLKLELTQDQIPKVIGITQLNAHQKEALTKRPA
ncbi:PREDICTED: recQ-mediated genome instability protein 1-like isoform X2 [Wasmannia auropunctata]|uniref:recQ-mediated genome instability protein 1-like isoform X2 n=1 Tax=Wasmannia auropunctata TaxID=64793 RepID=UPI0005EF06AC|nr:PREDICTED: recQ-mediated genome instability protein 1-like isoform X2 [Wasmannia auropunctata]